ncbi:hypothetical protein D3C72_1824030 [compost metagenome]
MAGVVTALKAHDDIRAFREPIYNLAFAFITPLGSDHHDIRHNSLPVDARREGCAVLKTRASILCCLRESDPVMTGVPPFLHDKRWI